MKFIKEHPIYETHAPLRPNQGDTYQKVDQAGDFPEDKKPSFGFNARHKQGDHYQQLASDFDSVEQTTKPKVGGKADARPSQGDKYQKLSFASETEDGSKIKVKHNHRPKQGDNYQNVDQGPEIKGGGKPSFNHNTRPKQGDPYQHLADFKSFK